MKRAGFTLIEIMIVVGIIAILLTGAVMSVASGRGAVEVKEATRGVMQLSRYAYALALLRQRPVVVTFHKKGRVEVRISGEVAESGATGDLADPIYLEVNGEIAPSSAGISKEDDDGDLQDDSPDVEASVKDEKKGLFYTRRVLDPEELSREDAEGEYEGVEFTVEVLDEAGNVLPPELAAARSLKQPERKKSPVSVFNSLDINADNEEDDESAEDDEEKPVSVTYETNGTVIRHRIIIRRTDVSDSGDGLVINVSVTGKLTVGDDEGLDEEVARGRRRDERSRR